MTKSNKYVLMNKNLTKAQLKAQQEEAEAYLRFKMSPIYFIGQVWGLTPQPPLPEHREEVEGYIRNLDVEKIEPKHYIRNYDPDNIEKHYKNDQEFERGKHITWQQVKILLCIERTLQNKASRKISIKSGNGIGKSCSAAWIIIWRLYCYIEAQIGCTSPSEQQLFDVLWKEISKWIKKMPQFMQNKLEWQSKYVRVIDDKNNKVGNEWFARAKTANKDAPESLSGIHGEAVLILADEASGIPNEVFSFARGSMSEKGAIQILISNPTRLTGYFKDSHDFKVSKKFYQTLSFRSLDSPVVDETFLDEFPDKSIDDEGYRMFVLGLFPKEDSVDNYGFVPLLSQSDRREIPAPKDLLDKSFWLTKPKLGIDPAGEGRDKTAFVVRDAFKAMIVKQIKISNPEEIAAVALQIINELGIEDDNVFIDQFGVGAKVAVILSKLGRDIQGIDVGDIPEPFYKKHPDNDKYLNIRARNYHGRLRKWICSGGQVVKDKAWEEEWLSNRFGRVTEQKNRIQLLSKQKMKKQGINSPNVMDALMLTFQEEEDSGIIEEAEQNNINDHFERRINSEMGRSNSNGYFVTHIPGVNKKSDDLSNLNSVF